MDKAKNFVVWLDGFLEACGNKLNEKQTKIIKEKLDGIFEHTVDKDGNKLDSLDIDWNQINMGLNTPPSINDVIPGTSEPTVYRC